MAVCWHAGMFSVASSLCNVRPHHGCWLLVFAADGGKTPRQILWAYYSWSILACERFLCCWQLRAPRLRSVITQSGSRYDELKKKKHKIFIQEAILVDTITENICEEGREQEAIRVTDAAVQEQQSNLRQALYLLEMCQCQLFLM